MFPDIVDNTVDNKRYYHHLSTQNIVFPYFSTKYMVYNSNFYQKSYPQYQQYPLVTSYFEK